MYFTTFSQTFWKGNKYPWLGIKRDKTRQFAQDPIYRNRLVATLISFIRHKDLRKRINL